MNTQALLNRQDDRQVSAWEILRDLRSLARWRAIGEPALCGATAHGLLVAPDIDVEIVGPADVRRGFGLVAEWAARPDVHRVLFIDALDGPDGGLGWQLTHHRDGLDWTVQMWLLPPDYPGPRAADLVQPLRRALTPERRAAILRIKEELLRTGRSFVSIDVYRAVVEHGVTNTPGFEAWPGPRARHDELLRWIPRAADT